MFLTTVFSCVTKRYFVLTSVQISPLEEAINYSTYNFMYSTQPYNENDLRDSIKRRDSIVYY